MNGEFYHFHISLCRYNLVNIATTFKLQASITCFLLTEKKNGWDHNDKDPPEQQKTVYYITITTHTVQYVDLVYSIYTQIKGWFIWSLHAKLNLKVYSWSWKQKYYHQVTSCTCSEAFSCISWTLVVGFSRYSNL